MNSRLSSRVVMNVLAAFALVVGLAATTQASLITIADWQFESDAFTADSSGNGHTLVNSGAVASTDAAAGVSSAYFNGSAGMYTTDAIDLSKYKQVQVKWSMKATGTDFGIVYEQGTSMNDVAGGLFTSINDAGAGSGGAAIHSESGYNVKYYPHDTSDTWASYEVDYNVDAVSSDLVTRVKRNGIDVTTLSSSYNVMPTTLASEVLNIGGRNIAGGGGFKYSGYLDALTITATVVPEPSTMAMVLTGVIGILCCAWRRQK